MLVTVAQRRATRVWCGPLGEECLEPGGFQAGKRVPVLSGGEKVCGASQWSVKECEDWERGRVIFGSEQLSVWWI